MPDLFTYAGNIESLVDLQHQGNVACERADGCDRATVSALLDRGRPRGLVHFTAESQVGRSIDAPLAVVRTNVWSAFELLESARTYFAPRCAADTVAFRFPHVSRDELFGSLGPNEAAFKEMDSYTPSSLYAASKEASDHFVHAWHHTGALPALTTNYSNNYGPHQFP